MNVELRVIRANGEGYALWLGGFLFRFVGTSMRLGGDLDEVRWGRDEFIWDRIRLGGSWRGYLGTWLG